MYAVSGRVKLASIGDIGAHSAGRYWVMRLGESGSKLQEYEGLASL